ncbi:acyl-CoA dehydrogenase family protein [Oceanicola sp. S124]|uniref:acyl-CoA dehydrogenase family protein n=1 Tax=Oceanicola sp. S124 TaxID=1042378 RepID=UPI0002559125|nr:acyl-CoA dehydrogenase family protein [Oceanicola sp. S124]
MFDDLDPKDFEETARSVMQACAEAPDVAARATTLAEAGLLGVTAPESVGGLGLPPRFAVPILEAAGAGLLAFPLIETMLLARALAGDHPELASALVAGETLATIAWLGTEAEGKVAGAPLGLAAAQVLVFRADGSAVLTATDGLAARLSDALDTDSAATEFTLGGAPEGIRLSASQVAALNDEAQILRAAFIAGSAASCLSQAADFAQDRVQFGRSLSSYQALRHRLSRDLLAVETLRMGLTRALADIGDAAPLARQAVWLGAARMGPGVAESAIQVFGGMGFTWEVPLHRHLRQMRALAQQGRAADQLAQLAGELISGTTNQWYEEVPDVV